jgi:hypothetical protein
MGLGKLPIPNVAMSDYLKQRTRDIAETMVLDSLLDCGRSCETDAER